MKKIYIKIYCITTALFMLFCDGDKMDINIKSTKDYKISTQQWEKLCKKRIYFGHKSVGSNIVGGIQHVLEEKSISLRIVQGNNIKDFAEPGFAHSDNGVNMDPKSKITDFVKTIDRGLGNKVDIAFFKFCYVDIMKSNDIQELFLMYKYEMQKLVKKYPLTKFIHVTVPLTSGSGLKGFIKKLIGRDFNPRRNKYNNLLKNEYSKDKILDLAAMESTSEDGKRCFYRQGSEIVYSLVSEYTDDGGHLNERGRNQIAQNFLGFLASIQD